MFDLFNMPVYLESNKQCFGKNGKPLRSYKHWPQPSSVQPYIKVTFKCLREIETIL